MQDQDTTYGRNARREYYDGRQAAASARDDAMEGLYCEVCGLKRAGRDVCRECKAGPEVRRFAKTSRSGLFPMDLADARTFVSNRPGSEGR